MSECFDALAMHAIDVAHAALTCAVLLAGYVAGRCEVRQ